MSPRCFDPSSSPAFSPHSARLYPAAVPASTSRPRSALPFPPPDPTLPHPPSRATSRGRCDDPARFRFPFFEAVRPDSAMLCLFLSPQVNRSGHTNQSSRLFPSFVPLFFWTPKPAESFFFVCRFLRRPPPPRCSPLPFVMGRRTLARTIFVPVACACKIFG